MEVPLQSTFWSILGIILDNFIQYKMFICNSDEGCFIMAKNIVTIILVYSEITII